MGLGLYVQILFHGLVAIKEFTQSLWHYQLTRVQWHFHRHHAPQCQVQLAVRDQHGYHDLAEAWPSLSMKWAAGMAS